VNLSENRYPGRSTGSTRAFRATMGLCAVTAAFYTVAKVVDSEFAWHLAQVSGVATLVMAVGFFLRDREQKVSETSGRN